MSKKIILLFIFISTVAVSCTKRPNACMEISATTVSVGTPVTFTSCSKNTLSQAWFFEGPPGAPENSQASSDLTFTHTFSGPGTYRIGLYAYREFSFTGEVSIAIDSIIVE